MKRELRALGQCAQQDKDQGGQIERMRADLIAGTQDDIEIIAADDVAEHDDAGKEAQAAGGGNGQRHAGAGSRAGVVMPVPDQEEGEDACQLPEEYELDQIA